MDQISPPSSLVDTKAAQAVGPFEHFRAHPPVAVGSTAVATPRASAVKTSRAARANQNLTQVAIDHLTKLASMPRGADFVPLVWSVAATAVINANTAAHQPFQQIVPVPAPIIKAVSQVMLAAPVHVRSAERGVDAADQLLHDFVCLPNDDEESLAGEVDVTRVTVGEQELGSAALPTPLLSLSPAPRETHEEVLALLDAAVADAARCQDESAAATCLMHPATAILEPPAVADSADPAPDSTPVGTPAIAEPADSRPDSTPACPPRRTPSRKAKTKGKTAVHPALTTQDEQNAQGQSSSTPAAAGNEVKELMILTNSRKTISTCPLLPDAIPYPKGMRKPDDPVMPLRGSARHKRARDGDVSDQDSDDDEPQLTPEQLMLKERRRRNTMSARVSRARKQAKLDVLEAEGTRLTAELQQAKEQIASLSKMVSRKEQVISHLVCSQEATKVAKKAVLDAAAPNVVAASIAVTLLTRIQALEQFGGHLLLEWQASGVDEASTTVQKLQAAAASDAAAPVVATASI
ncbi:hypothetical protein GGF32_009919 [Allomyces javanicus]|nr:hypothetical protein GGF32_009919 [Allomyces javanicus]